MARVVLPLTESWIDYPDPTSNAVNVFFSGCAFSCPGCHNPELLTYEYVHSVLIDGQGLYDAAIDFSNRLGGTDKIVFQGGDPLHPYNRDCVMEFLEINKHFQVCIYTGYTITTIEKIGLNGYSFIKCGTYERDKAQQGQKLEDKLVLASTNQQLFDKDNSLLSDNGVYYFQEA